MRVLTLAGSPRFPSRSTSLLALCQRKLEASGVEVIPWNIHNFQPEDLINARFDSPAILALSEDLAQADGLVIATPVYKASFSGALKTVLDLLPERALAQKVVLPLASGGSAGHMLALDYALKPVLNALKAEEVLHGVYAEDKQIHHYDRQPELDPVLATRLEEAVHTFWLALSRRHQPVALAV
ncbi:MULTISPECIES: NADPH-dependent FMN reductase [Pantoea]|uniref:NADPH-dependent FMN reductase n=1 Tax=Pantoea TaxID=53335 RepID=UPI001C896D22|nr:NADPH-dependent FMN reductase [Pantoea ananatis]QZE27976.1 NADPH-dependent FMN reductase [Pantoea ananatis]